MTKVLIIIDRPEDYDDVCAELVAEDFLATKGEGWSYHAEDEINHPTSKLPKEMAEALDAVQEWNKARKFIVPYRVTDPIYSVLQKYHEQVGE